MAGWKRSVNLRKRELSQENFIVGVYFFMVSFIFGKINFEKLVSPLWGVIGRREVG